ncbi:TetR-like C-terminal domain-containing protein [Clostridium chromiireducens]|uniref:TetR-like C-terminal domain-containing protein n=1 Tax=Clostridium chromiireducens TaxID=225345 RepID=UPI003AF9456F
MLNDITYMWTGEECPYIASADMALIRKWIQNGMKEPPQEMAYINYKKRQKQQG